jgi:outer membrane protein
MARFVLGLAFAALMLLAEAGQAQDLPPSVTAVVDFQRLMNDSAAARSINEQIDARRKVYLEELSGEEQRLYEADRELASQRSVLSPEIFAERRRSFEQEVQAAQRLSQERRRQLEDARAEALAVVRTEIVETIGELARARGFNLVLPSSGVLLFTSEIDLTEAVMERLDKELPEVKVPAKTE